MLENVVLGIVLVIVVVAIVLLVRTRQFAGPTQPVQPVEGIPVDASRVAEHLGRAIRCQTISRGEGQPPDSQAFNEFHQALKEMFPLVHQHLKLHRINQLSLLYQWEGTKPGLPGVMFTAHQDVVPVDQGSIAEWQQPPFDGVIADGFVWGRGALDIKSQVISVLEAVESLLKSGFRPQRTVFLGFGHDEEIGGLNGAKPMAAWMKEQGFHLAALIDEGGEIVKDYFPGVTVPAALVGYAEKGYLTLELVVEARPGHSANPPKQTAIGILAKGLARLEARPLPTNVSAPTPLYKGIGMAAPFLKRLEYANLWLLGGLVRRSMEAKPETNAAIRTTTAITIIHAGVKDNILPGKVTAKVNFRLMPGDTVSGVIEHVRNSMADERIQIHKSNEGGWEAPPPSPIDCDAFHLLERTVRQVFGNIPVAPYLVQGATDSKYYSVICDAIYRFSPVEVNPDDRHRVHGINERIQVDALARMVKFFGQLIPTWSEMS